MRPTQCPVPHDIQRPVAHHRASSGNPTRADWLARCQTIFYDRLFHDIPGAQGLFIDEHRQCRMFRTLIDIAFNLGQRGEKLRPSLRHLGRHHNERGILSLHMKGGRAALIEAFSTVFADDAEIDPEILGTIYDRLIADMLDTPLTPDAND
ncbi:globin [Marivibrio halodurans]|uniref:Globin n=1 Tax=Marivibrio halodurans TaxID=2039722 RepID=A0A8J7V3T9_9PROT|nr:globin [Marivibrio halodurans]MBP5856999.1 globin [Marivibrio halodurans]